MRPRCAGSTQTFNRIGSIDRELIHLSEQLVDLVDDPTTLANLLIAQE